MTDDFAEAIARAATVLRGRTIAVLTGAGISTDSGIPAYRGAGTTPRTPMTGPTFLSDEAARRRYWLGSHLGWRRFASIAPNAGHRAIADMEQSGAVSGVITQNVDDLHRRAGSSRVIELHGTMHRISCTKCGEVFDRYDIAARIETENPWIAVPEHVVLGPDGDVSPSASDAFVVPACPVCGGVLRPDIVFFGEYVPAARFAEAEELVNASDALLVAGTSLVVNSGIRIIERARRRDLPIVLVNHEPTKADEWSDAVLRQGTSQALPALAHALRNAG